MRKLLMSLLMAGSLLAGQCRRRSRGRRVRSGRRFGPGVRYHGASAPAPDASAAPTRRSAPAADASAAAARRRAGASEAAPAAPTAPFSVDSSKINSGDTAWMLTSTALVLFMTIPGLALFYGGMVRKKNVLATRDAELRDHLPRDDHLDGGRLQPRVHAGQLVHRRLLARLPGTA